MNEHNLCQRLLPRIVGKTSGHPLKTVGAQAAGTLLLAMLLGACAGAKALRTGASTTGKASYYAAKFAGRTTASGETYDPGQLTAAHPTLPFGTRVRVERLPDGPSVDVRINDRGPFADNRIIDLSRAAAERLRMIGEGVVRVRVTVLQRPGGANTSDPSPSAREGPSW